MSYCWRLGREFIEFKNEKIMNQENEIEVLGFWWVLGHSEDRFPGILKYSKENGTVLQILCDRDYKEFWDYNKRYDIIYGVADNMTFTMYHCSQAGSSESGVNYYSFRSEYLFVHNTNYLENGEDMAFNRIDVRMNNTNDFFRGFQIFNVEKEYGETNDTGKYTIDYNLKQIGFNINDKLTGNIRTGYNQNEQFSEKTFSIEGKIWFCIESNDNSLISIHLLLDKMNYLRIFFSIVVQGMTVYDEVVGKRFDFEQDMKIYLRNDFGEPFRRFTIFDYDKVNEKFSSILERWFHLTQEIPEVINLFYNTYTSTNFYEYHYRDTYVALEGLYRWKLKRNTSGNIVPGLLNTINSKKDIFPIFLKIVENYKIWGETARKNRVYLTHLNEEISTNDLVDNVGLLKLMRKMQAIILFYILEELRLSDDEIETSFRKLETYFLPFIF